MADAKKPPAKGGDKKDAKKPAAAPTGQSTEMEIVFIIFFIAIICLVVIPIVSSTFGINITGGSFSTWWTGFQFAFARFISDAVSTLIFTSVFTTLLLVIGILYAKFKLNEVNELAVAAKQKAKPVAVMTPAGSSAGSFSTASHIPDLPGATHPSMALSPENARWKDVQKKIQSANNSDWRLAIIEADIMLYDMLEEMGYPGDSIGDKLKVVEPASFNTLDDAWRAHKVRNIIAHEGASYVISRSEAEKAISQYEKVFKEFYLI